MKEYDLTSELWREYDFTDSTYRINNPVKLFLYEDSTTHRVLDDKGIVHCLPAPGRNGCVVRWKSKDPLKSVSF